MKTSFSSQICYRRGCPLHSVYTAIPCTVQVSAGVRAKGFVGSGRGSTRAGTRIKPQPGLSEAKAGHSPLKNE